MSKEVRKRTRSAVMPPFQFQRFAQDSEGKSVLIILINATVNFKFPGFASRAEVSNRWEEHEIIVLVYV